MTQQFNKPVTIIFDFDGTIADSFSFFLALMNQLAKKYGFEQIPHDQIEMYRSMSSHEIIEQFHIPALRLPFVVLEARKHLKQCIQQIPLVKEIKTTIAQLRDKNISLGIITSNSVKNVNLFLKHHDVVPFDFIISSLKIWEKSKTLKKALNHYKLNYKTAFYIGDETRDIEAAHEAGIKSIAVTWGYNSEDILRMYSPEYLIDDPKTLLTITDQAFTE